MDFHLEEFLDLDIALGNALEDSPDWPDLAMLQSPINVDPSHSWNDASTPISFSSLQHENFTNPPSASSLHDRHDGSGETLLPAATSRKNEDGKNVWDSSGLPCIPPSKSSRLV